jgi:uncharacterized SAM-binding protein YcdF (DUF218 family)
VRPPRVVAVLGFSGRGAEGLHPVCAARVDRAAELARADDVVVLSGWARARGATSEAQLMSRAWSGAPARMVLDDGARHTAENAAHAAQVARALGAREVVVVTSRWHAPRAALIFRWFLRGSGARVVVATARGPLAPGPVAREVAVWPLVAAQIARTRRAPRGDG